ncbi:NAD(P)H-quinone oxidoreductase [Marinobacter hydrocarbonoclasticus]|nr:NAD(P)H-quinone oxidoreductase [Marinobacter nauticus]
MAEQIATAETMALWRAEQGKAVPGRGPIPTPGAEQVLIRVAACGVNRADLLQVAGHYPPPAGAPDHLGLEVSGIVEVAAGPFQKGDRVMALLAGGGYAEYVAVHVGSVLPVPATMSMSTAAALPEAFVTAYQCLFALGGLKAGERVLIHAGASGVGTAAIQLARAAGAEVTVTCGSQEKASRCVSLGADQAINRRTQDFADHLTGVDVVLDPVGGDYLARNLRIMAPQGRLIQIAMMGGRRAEVDLAQLLAKRLTLIGSTLRSQPQAVKTELVQGLWSDFGEAFHDGRIAPLVDSRYDFESVPEAHRRMAENGNIGKLVLELNSVCP